MPTQGDTLLQRKQQHYEQQQQQQQQQQRKRSSVSVGVAAQGHRRRSRGESFVLLGDSEVLVMDNSLGTPQLPSSPLAALQQQHQQQQQQQPQQHPPEAGGSRLTDAEAFLRTQLVADPPPLQTPPTCSWAADDPPVEEQEHVCGSYFRGRRCRQPPPQLEAQSQQVPKHRRPRPPAVWEAAAAAAIRRSLENEKLEDAERREQAKQRREVLLSKLEGTKRARLHLEMLSGVRENEKGGHASYLKHSRAAVRARREHKRQATAVKPLIGTRTATSTAPHMRSPEDTIYSTTRRQAATRHLLQEHEDCTAALDHLSTFDRTFCAHTGRGPTVRKHDVPFSLQAPHRRTPGHRPFIVMTEEEKILLKSS